MTQDIFDQIKSHYNTFTKAEKRVADYVLQNPQKVLYMSITDLADACEMGDTSVFRFCRHLKCKGYQDFKVHLAQSMGGEREAAPVAGEVGEDDTLDQVAMKVLASNQGAITKTYKLLNMQDISTAVDWMISAGRVSFFGVGASMVSALEAKNRFMRITPKVDMALDVHLQSMSAALLTPNDLAVVISYSGTTKDTVAIAQTAKEAGAKLICITRFTKSPLASLCDLRLLCGANEGPLQGGSMSAKLSQLFLLELLYMEYFRRTYSHSSENKALTAGAIAEKLY